MDEWLWWLSSHLRIDLSPRLFPSRSLFLQNFLKARHAEYYDEVRSYLSSTVSTDLSYLFSGVKAVALGSPGNFELAGEADITYNSGQISRFVKRKQRSHVKRHLETERTGLALCFQECFEVDGGNQVEVTAPVGETIFGPLFILVSFLEGQTFLIP